MFRYIAMAILAAVLLTGCLTPVTKEYKINVNSDGSGKGTIRFVDIISSEPEDDAEMQSDFDELINDYLEGTYFEDDYPGMIVTDKKLFEEKGVLVGQIDFEFESIEALEFFRYDECDCCPWMLLGLISDENLITSNGETVDGENPIYIWPPDTKEMEFTTVLSSKSDGKSLLPLYKEWKQ